MGGYALYVWSSFALVLVVMVANVVIPMVNHKSILEQMRRSAARRAARSE